MHAMGFEHEQTRFDRDMYVEVQWKNIKAGEEHNFEKLPRTFAYPSFDFDFMSLMMYTLDAFGKEGKPSMIVVVRSKILLFTFTFSISCSFCSKIQTK
jgi:hypothetical protein